MTRDELNKMRDDHAQTILELRDLAERQVAAAKQRERRERIATAVLQGLLAHHGEARDRVPRATAAVAFADALIAELDKEVKP